MGPRHHLSRNLNEVKYYIKLLYFYVQNTIDGQNTVYSVSLNELKIIKKTPCQTTLVLFVACLPLVLTRWRPLPIFSISHFVPLGSCCPLSSSPPSTLGPFTALLCVVTPWCVISSEDLELATPDEKD